MTDHDDKIDRLAQSLYGGAHSTQDETALADLTKYTPEQIDALAKIVALEDLIADLNSQHKDELDAIRPHVGDDWLLSRDPRPTTPKAEALKEAILTLNDLRLQMHAAAQPWVKAAPHKMWGAMR